MYICVRTNRFSEPLDFLELWQHHRWKSCRRPVSACHLFAHVAPRSTARKRTRNELIWNNKSWIFYVIDHILNKIITIFWYQFEHYYLPPTFFDDVIIKYNKNNQPFVLTYFVQTKSRISKFWRLEFLKFLEYVLFSTDNK